MPSREKLSVLAAHEYRTAEGIKTRWLRVGSAFPARNGGYDCIVEAIPAPKVPEGGGSAVWRFNIRPDDREGYYGPGEPRRGEVRDNQNRRPPQHRDDFRQGGGGEGPAPDGTDDDIPFKPVDTRLL